MNRCHLQAHGNETVAKAAQSLGRDKEAAVQLLAKHGLQHRSAALVPAAQAPLPPAAAALSGTCLAASILDQQHTTAVWRVPPSGVAVRIQAVADTTIGSNVTVTCSLLTAVWCDAGRLDLTVEPSHQPSPPRKAVAGLRRPASAVSSFQVEWHRPLYVGRSKQGVCDY